MILHEIVVHKPPPVPAKPHKHITHKLKEKYKGIQGTEDHKRFIHRRAVRDCHFERGEQVIYRRNGYKIVDIYGEDDFRFVNWTGLAPNFIEIVDGFGEIQLVNPGSLKRNRN